ncbi:MAG: hypothetical protein IPH06_05565 [Alphaproteobacteria bacterium]|nr:hypothetical protein [Alphaproteobacteria bacterium]QQS57488.1 MAG: hypothetical protein IPN28_01330 [Alphaproteobacteria bacterium]
MLTIDFEKKTVWDQVEGASFDQLQQLDLFTRCHLMRRLGEEYAENINPETPEAYRTLLYQEGMLRDLFVLDNLRPIEFSSDAAAIADFASKAVESGDFQKWKTQWEESDFFKRRGVIFQIQSQFGKAFGIDIRSGHAKIDTTELMEAEVHYSEGSSRPVPTVTISRATAVQDDFNRAFHSIVYACARLYQDGLVYGNITREKGSPREELAYRTFGDVPAEDSMFWEADGFHPFMNQPTRRHASWLADTALQTVAEKTEPEDPDFAQRMIKDINAGTKSRYQSTKILYAANMKVQAPEDVWNAVQAILPADIRSLSIGAQSAVVNLASDIHGRGEKIPEDLNKAINRILESYPLTPDYKKFLMERQGELLLRMANDPVLQKAKTEWDTYRDYQKIRTLQHAVNLHAEIFGCSPAYIQTVDIPPVPNPDGNGSIVTYGNYLWRQPNARMNLNVNADAGVLEHFYQALNTVMHEQQHRFQDYLAKEVEWKGLKPEHPLYNQARFFSAGSYVYVTHEQNQDHYQNNPLERDSFAFGNGVAFFIALADDRQRNEYFRKMEAIHEHPRGTEIDLTRGFDKLPWAHHPPMPEPDGY